MGDYKYSKNRHTQGFVALVITGQKPKSCWLQEFTLVIHATNQFSFPNLWTTFLFFYYFFKLCFDLIFLSTLEFGKKFKCLYENEKILNTIKSLVVPSWLFLLRQSIHVLFSDTFESLLELFLFQDHIPAVTLFFLTINLFPQSRN